jgi:multidrug efflux pump subunit AcrA (membrane-fusion protein)
MAKVKDVHVHVHVDVDMGGVGPQLQEIQETLNEMGDTMADLAEDVAALKARLNEDWDNAQQRIAELTAQLADVGAQLVAALGNDAADAATIQAKQEEIDALVAAAQAASDEINAIDLDASFPPAPEPEPDPGNGPGPVDDGGGDDGVPNQAPDA